MPWDYFSDSKLYSEVEKIYSLYPIKQEALGAYHEKINLALRKDFFDNVESNPLTDEQRLGVLRSNDKNMVLAAAGTGKTSVMVAKALDLVDRGLASPQEILVLAYNKSAAEELKNRLADKAENSGIVLTETPQISTFHALGRKILGESNISTYMSVFTEDSLKLGVWVTEWLIEYLTQDPKRMVDFISLFPEPVNPFDFKTQEEYERHIRDNEFRTLQGELVKGYQELNRPGIVGDLIF
ncbi:UvrD-helicase domain-containing protein [Psychrobacter faecalis]|uniref:UvrD-helicase domain-containing protein n=1 Tax=Psychrobacter faecalis TaxID=180588 RepID=UPI003FD63507